MLYLVVRFKWLFFPDEPPLKTEADKFWLFTKLLYIFFEVFFVFWIFDADTMMVLTFIVFIIFRLELVCCSDMLKRSFEPFLYFFYLEREELAVFEPEGARYEEPFFSPYL